MTAPISRARKSRPRDPLQYAENKVDMQITQLQNMINDGVDVLVVASIDGALGPGAPDGRRQHIIVIAYDRSYRHRERRYYATFDNYRRHLPGEASSSSSTRQRRGPVQPEPFAGSPDDNNAKFFFAGA